MVRMASAEVEAYRKHMRKLVWGLGTKVDWKGVVVGCMLMCIGMSAMVILLIQVGIADTPPTGVRLVVAFVFFVAALAGYMIMHRGTERSWL